MTPQLGSEPEFQPIVNDMTEKIDQEIVIAQARKDWMANHLDDPRADDEEWVNTELEKINEHYRVKTQAEVIDLINQWCADACWDLADSEGFEMHHDALLAVQEAKQKEWKQEETDRIVSKGNILGVSVTFVHYLEIQEHKVDRLERELAELRERVNGLEPIGR